MSHLLRPSAPGFHDVGSRQADASTSAASLELKAARLHHLSRMRQTQFNLPLLADEGMAVMLTLFVAGLQGRPLSEDELARANLMSRQALERLMDELIQAGLVVTTGESPVARSVGLTPLGSARMRSYVDALPVV